MFYGDYPSVTLRNFANINKHVVGENCFYFKSLYAGSVTDAKKHVHSNNNDNNNYYNNDKDNDHDHDHDHDNDINIYIYIYII